MKGLLMFIVGLVVGAGGMFWLLSQSMNLMTSDLVTAVVNVVNDNVVASGGSGEKVSLSDQVVNMDIASLKAMVMEKVKEQEEALKMDVSSYVKKMIGTEIDKLLGSK